MKFGHFLLINETDFSPTPQPALDALLSGEFRESLGEVFYSDDEDGYGLGEEDGLIIRPRLVTQPVTTNSTLKMK